MTRSNKYSIKGVSVTFSDGSTKTGDLLFNICDVRNNPPTCPAGTNSVGYFTYAGGCAALSRNSGGTLTEWSYEAFNKNKKEEDGIKIVSNNQDSTTPFNVTFAFKCDDSVKEQPTLSASQLAENNNLVITVTHSKACGFEILGPFNFMTHYKIGIIFVGLVLGVCLAFFGFRVFKYSLALLGFMVG